MLIMHILIILGMLTLSSLLIAPIFGVAPNSEALILGLFFGVLALLILFLNINMIRERTKKRALLLAGASLLWMSLWCLLVSAYDMKGYIVAYIVVTLPLLVLRMRYSESGEL
jgi:uncharacterized membrane protein YecN with MAPEG domain